MPPSITFVRATLNNNGRLIVVVNVTPAGESADVFFGAANEAGTECDVAGGAVLIAPMVNPNPNNLERLRYDSGAGGFVLDVPPIDVCVSSSNGVARETITTLTP